jgi:hypothetical protein
MRRDLSKEVEVTVVARDATPVAPDDNRNFAMNLGIEIRRAIHGVPGQAWSCFANDAVEFFHGSQWVLFGKDWGGDTQQQHGKEIAPQAVRGLK